MAVDSYVGETAPAGIQELRAMIVALQARVAVLEAAAG